MKNLLLLALIVIAAYLNRHLPKIIMSKESEFFVNKDFLFYLVCDSLKI